MHLNNLSCLRYCLHPQHTIQAVASLGDDDKREQDTAQASQLHDIPFPVFVLALTALLLGPAKHHVPTAVPSSNTCCDRTSNISTHNVCQQACCQGHTAWHCHEACITHQTTSVSSNIPGDIVLGHNLEGLLQIHVGLRSIAITGGSLALHVLPAASRWSCSLLCLCTLPITCSTSVINTNAQSANNVPSSTMSACYTFTALSSACTNGWYTMWAFVKPYKTTASCLHSPLPLLPERRF